jgi:hypothetical protein
MQKNYNIENEYINLVNISRVIYVYIIQLLYDKNIKLNGNVIQKFLVQDSELDLEEKGVVRNKLVKYNDINRIMDISKKIGKFFNLFKDYKNLTFLNGIEW